LYNQDQQMSQLAMQQLLSQEQLRHQQQQQQQHKLGQDQMLQLVNQQECRTLYSDPILFLNFRA